MANDQQNSNQLSHNKYDLVDRTISFSKQMIDFTKQLPLNTITQPLVSQLIRAATSIGANYSEADEANSKKDFINKIVIAKKESKETRYWLTLIAHAIPSFKDKATILCKEAQELNLIFAAIIRNKKEPIGH